jgi:hypothetical protein
VRIRTSAVRCQGGVRKAPLFINIIKCVDIRIYDMITTVSLEVGNVKAVKIGRLEGLNGSC